MSSAKREIQERTSQTRAKPRVRDLNCTRSRNQLELQLHDFAATNLSLRVHYSVADRFLSWLTLIYSEKCIRSRHMGRVEIWKIKLHNTPVVMARFDRLQADLDSRWRNENEILYLSQFVHNFCSLSDAWSCKIGISGIQFQVYPKLKKFWWLWTLWYWCAR